MSKKHHGSTLDDFLKTEGVFEETQALAIKEVMGQQLIEQQRLGQIGTASESTALRNLSGKALGVSTSTDTPRRRSSST